jgi:uncharacterized protein
MLWADHSGFVRTARNAFTARHEVDLDQVDFIGLRPGRQLPHNGAVRPSQAVHLHRSRIRQIALSHRVQDVRVFGSVARGEDTEHSDLDLLVMPTEETTLMDIGAIRAELKQLLGVDIDVLTPGSLPDLHRERIFEEALPV